MWKKGKRFWKAGLAVAADLAMAGCSAGAPKEGHPSSEEPEPVDTLADKEEYPSGEAGFEDAESIAAAYRDIYEEAVEADTLGSLETLQRIVARLGEKGYVAVDSENQVDMAGAGQVIRPLDGGGFQYVSNQMLSLAEESDIWWHSDRLTEEEWLEAYGGTE